MGPDGMVRFLILEKGFSEAKIARLVETSQPTINRIKNGSGTTYEIGKRIESLYELNKDSVSVCEELG